ncbi:MAG: helix-turn-helix domain-containing protein, partial [Desulfovibrio sp.]|nr:helix-turn-helix domain-containing protein [Desulfovibrio sp.]
YGMPIGQYMQAFRMKRAAELISGTAMRMQKIAASVGYGHPGKFAQTFRERMHLSPSAYRRAGGRAPGEPVQAPGAEELPGGSSCIGKTGPEATS